MARRRHLKITVEGKVYDVLVDDVTEDDVSSSYSPPDLTSQVTWPDPAMPSTPSVAAPAAAVGANDQLAPMGGMVLEITVKEGDKVATGDQVVVIEAMKMKQSISAHRQGTVGKVHVSVGQAVDTGQPLVTIE